MEKKVDLLIDLFEKIVSHASSRGKTTVEGLLKKDWALELHSLSASNVHSDDGQRSTIERNGRTQHHYR
jgi:hypothetical protein